MTQGPIKPAPRPPAGAPQFTARPLPILDNQSLDTRGGMKVLYWGDVATGKTTYILSWPGLVIFQFDPDAGTVLGSSARVPVIMVNSWDMWESQILPLITQRRVESVIQQSQEFKDYKVQTVAVDSFTYLGELAEDVAKQKEPNRGDRMFGVKKDLLRRSLLDLLGPNSAASPRAGLPYYNIIGAVHEREAYRDTKDEKGKDARVLDRVVASITGSMGDSLFQYFSTVLNCQKRVRGVGTVAEQRMMGSAEFYCDTDQTDYYKKHVFDRYGGGRFPRLPKEVSGDYATLCKYWFPEGHK